MNFIFLTKEQVVGENKLSIFNKYNVEAKITDFALLLGGTNINYLKGRNQYRLVSWWWTKSSDMNGDAFAIKADDLVMSLFVNHREIGARPAFKYSEIKTKDYDYNEDGSIIYYGEYPQTIVSSEEAKILEKAYQDNTIKRTGKVYTTDLVGTNSCIKSFKEKKHIEYEYDRKKYIRLVSDSNRYYQTLSNSNIIRQDAVYWIKVEPIKWIIDKKADLAVSVNVLFSGIQFNNKRNYNGNFETTDIKMYMDNYFANEIVPSLSNDFEYDNYTFSCNQFNLIEENQIVKKRVKKA